MQWIVVDDGDPRSEIDEAPFAARGIELTRIYPSWTWKKDECTLSRNLLAAIPEVKYEVVLFIEDDDWYADDYVAAQACRIGDAEMVGEAPARYYHLPTRQYWTLGNFTHASLCQTGIKASLLPALKDICLQPALNFIDVRLWEGCKGKKALRPGVRSVGMKGMPGRPGIGVGHRPRIGGAWRSDADYTVLRKWVGAEDAAVYRGL